MNNIKIYRLIETYKHRYLKAIYKVLLKEKICLNIFAMAFSPLTSSEKPQLSLQNVVPPTMSYILVSIISSCFILSANDQ